MKRRPMLFANGNDIVGSVRVISEDDLNNSEKVKEFELIKPTTLGEN